jgi:hypothetical protein
MPDSKTRTLADVLRAAADLIAQHPDLPPPYITTSSHMGEHTADLAWYLMIGGGRTLADQKADAARIVSTIDGKWEKLPDTYSDFVFRQQRGPLKLDVQVTREAVCERIVTGVESVTIPAKAAVPARTEEREIVEWRCEPLLAEATS